MWYRSEFGLTCEQAFGRAGNWGEGKAKRALSPLPFPSLSTLFFFPKQTTCSQAKFELNVLFIDLPTYKKMPFNALVFTLRSKVVLIWTRAMATR